MKVALAILCFITLFFLPSVVSAQSLQERLAQNVSTFDSQSTSTIEQLIEVAQRFHIPLGVEWLDLSDEKEPSPIHVQDISVAELIGQIIKQQPGYNFRIMNGVVHVYAAPLISDQKNFINLRISRFELNRANLSEARFHLWGSIIMALRPNGGYGGGYRVGSGYADFDLPKVSLSGQNLTVRELLNRIVVAQGNALWLTRIRMSEVLPNEPFYVSVPSIKHGEASKTFGWQFVALDVNRQD